MTSKATIVIASDSSGIELKEDLRDHLLAAGYLVTDVSSCVAVKGDPIALGRAVAEAVAGGGLCRGVLIAGARVHVTLSACQIPGVRAAYLADPLSAEQAISRDRANVVALSAHNTNPEAARRLVDLWLHNNRRPQEGERQPSRKVQKAERIDEVYRLLDAVYG